MKRYLALLGIVLAGQAGAGPFGLEMGMTIEDIKKLQIIETERAEFGVKTVPKPHPKLTSYYLIATPQHGLCKLSAGNPEIRTNVYGTDLRNVFDAIKKGLTEKYGKPDNDFDFLRPGSIWKEPGDFMMGLVKQERTLATYWDAENRPLPDHLKVILLEAGASSTNIAYIVIRYEFENSEACLDSLEKQDNSSL